MVVTFYRLERRPRAGPCWFCGSVLVEQQKAGQQFLPGNLTSCQHFIEALDLIGSIPHGNDHDSVGLPKTPARPDRIGRVAHEQQEMALGFLFFQPGGKLMAHASKVFFIRRITGQGLLNTRAVDQVTPADGLRERLFDVSGGIAKIRRLAGRKQGKRLGPIGRRFLTEEPSYFREDPCGIALDHFGIRRQSSDPCIVRQLDQGADA